MKKKLALLLSLAIAVSMTACQSATPQPEETPAETTQDTTVYEAKEYTEDEFWKLRITSPDANTPDNPSRWGDLGYFRVLTTKKPENLGFNLPFEESDYVIKGMFYRNIMKDLSLFPSWQKTPYTKDDFLSYDTVGGVLEGLTQEYNESTDFYGADNYLIEYEMTEMTSSETGEKLLVRNPVVMKNDEVAEWHIKNYGENIMAAYELWQKYGGGNLHGGSYWFTRAEAEADAGYLDSRLTWGLNGYGSLENMQAAEVNFNDVPKVTDGSFRTNFDQTHKDIKANEYPKILPIIERYINAKYLGSEEVYKEDFTEDFLATPNFNPEVIKEYYNKNGILVTSIKDLKIRNTNFERFAVPVIAEYTLCTEKGEYYCRDYFFFIYTYNEETDDFSYQMAYSMNSEALIEADASASKEDPDRYETEERFLSSGAF
ncbi:MAG: hypothetical protein IKL70_05660 [Oscillospiraceae bacterium]|nr:hypothetical protein [Oscillospiraceae bacterium]